MSRLPSISDQLPYNVFLAFALWRTAEHQAAGPDFFCQTISLLQLDRRDRDLKFQSAMAAR